jgi:hypothetical protein
MIDEVSMWNTRRYPLSVVGYFLAPSIPTDEALRGHFTSARFILLQCTACWLLTG